jgi:hypothetical protein
MVLLPISGLFFVLCLASGDFFLTLTFGAVFLMAVYLTRGAPHLVSAVSSLEKHHDARQATTRIRQSAMPQATPEQSKSVRYRRRSLMVSFIGWGILWIGPLIFGKVLLGAAFGAWLFGVWVIGMAILIPAGYFIWRCPICGHPFGRGSSGKFCKNCETRFE